MLFNSLDFAVFFPIVFLFYWVVSKNLQLRNILILVASYVFYGWWDWRFLILIIISSTIDFYIGGKLEKSKNIKRRKMLLYISLFVNLGFLGYFKYTNFFIETFVDSFKLFGKTLEVSTLNIILPVGISFYTFQTLSYTIDIYRNQLKPTNDPIAFFAFVSFFPQLVAGPIERASHLLPQFYKTYKFNYNQVKSGLLLVGLGLFKKMVIADRAALYVNEVYNNPTNYDGVESIIATILFAFQIYCDFSGYSDIAIGTARTLGFDLMRNFDSPYLSKSITEFWRRWHISLSTWFRDYVYFPLGGSRGGNYKTYFNLFIVFLVSGLWHGAALTFIIWGAIHGLIIVFEKSISKDQKEIINKIINLSIEKNFNLLFTTVSFHKDYYKKTKNAFEIGYSQLREIINNNNRVKLFDINKLVNLDRSYFMGGKKATYNYNNQHLNYKGNIKTSNILSNFINDNYKFYKNNKARSTLHEAFYGDSLDSSINSLRGEIIAINDKQFEHSNANLLITPNDFDSSVWYKGNIEKYKIQFPKEVLEKGEYEIFHMARTNENIFFRQKVENRFLIIK